MPTPMKRKDFDELCGLMKSYELCSEMKYLPETYLIVRLDGSNFHQFTDKMGYEKPFDEGFSNMMRECTVGLMEKYPILYGYTQSDEVSLLFSSSDFFRYRVEKISTVLASDFASRFGLLAGEPVAFDGRIITLPNSDLVKQYFEWRMEDANRNGLNLWLYWTLRHEGMSKNEAGNYLLKKGVDFKNEELFKRGINYNDVPTWTKRGVGLKWKNYEKSGYNPIKDETVTVERRRVFEQTELPIGTEYYTMIDEILCTD